MPPSRLRSRETKLTLVSLPAHIDAPFTRRGVASRVRAQPPAARTTAAAEADPAARITDNLKQHYHSALQPGNIFPAIPKCTMIERTNSPSLPLKDWKRTKHITSRMATSPRSFALRCSSAATSLRMVAWSRYPHGQNSSSSSARRKTFLRGPQEQETGPTNRRNFKMPENTARCELGTLLSNRRSPY